jgi:hypothetical protein
MRRRFHAESRSAGRPDRTLGRNDVVEQRVAGFVEMPAALSSVSMYLNVKFVA